MGVRFRKKIKVAPGVSINLNKKSVGVIAGVKGAHVSVNTDGQKTTSVGIPGAGLSYVDIKNIQSNKTAKSHIEQQEHSNCISNINLPKNYEKFNTDKWREFRKKYSSKSLKIYSLIFKVFGIFFLIVSLPSFAIGIGSGVIALLISFIMFKLTSSYKTNIKIQELNLDTTNMSDTIKAPSLHYQSDEFPNVDKNGRKILQLKEVCVSGVTHSHDGCDPQDYIPYLSEGEELILEADINNKYDKFAVKVLDAEGHYLGWLPSGTKDVFERLTNNETVLAKVKTTEHFNKYDEELEEYFEDEDAPMGITLVYARYAKITNKN